MFRARFNPFRPSSKQNGIVASPILPSSQSNLPHLLSSLFLSRDHRSQKMATATTTVASFSTAVVRCLCFPTSTSIRLHHITTSARPNPLISTPTPHRLLPLIRFSATTSPSSTTASTISVEDKLPDATLSYFGSDGELKTITISYLTKGKKTILFAVPGFVEKGKELKAKGSFEGWG